MKSCSNVKLHPNALAKKHALGAQQSSLRSRIKLRLRKYLVNLLCLIPVRFVRYRIACGRKLIFDKTCKVISVIKNNPAVEDCGVGNYADHGRLPREGHVFFTKSMRHVRLVGPSLIPIDQDGYLAKEAVNFCRLNDLTITTLETRILRNTKPFKIHTKCISLCAIWTHRKNYYHWIIDVVPRLRAYSDDCHIIIRDPLATYEKQTLEMLGLLDKCIYITGDHLLVDNYKFISPHATLATYDPDSLDFLRETFLGKVKQPNKPLPTKFYLTREGGRRSPPNECRLAERFYDMGWDIIECSDYSLNDQIALFNNATHIAGCHGAALVNLLWIKPECRVFEIFPIDRILPTAEMLALHIGASHYSLITNSLTGAPIDVDWIVEVVKTNEHLEAS
jgi:hypothetical protein